MSQSASKARSKGGPAPVSALHPLRTKKILPISGWVEFLRLWENTSQLTLLESLLHSGFDVEMDQGGKYGERVGFYLTIANGWRDKDPVFNEGDWDIASSILMKREGKEVKLHPHEIRQVLAKKAYNVLCLEFFRKVSLLREDDPSWCYTSVWEQLIFTEDFLPVLQEFFRPAGGTRRPFPNLSPVDRRATNESHIVAFLLNMARFAWQWGGECEYPLHNQSATERAQHNKAMRERVHAARPWLIEILSYLGELSLLETKGWLLKLDVPCLAKLKYLALQSELVQGKHPVEKSRRVKTLDEACLAESEPAWLLVKYDLGQREVGRLDKICTLERTKNQTDRELAQLQ